MPAARQSMGRPLHCHPVRYAVHNLYRQRRLRQAGRPNHSPAWHAGDELTVDLMQHRPLVHVRQEDDQRDDATVVRSRRLERLLHSRKVARYCSSSDSPVSTPSNPDAVIPLT